MAKLKVVRLPLDRIVPDPGNARTHPEANVEAIRASLERFGQVEPLVLQKGTGRLIAGHGRRVAMEALGWKEADVVEVDVNDPDASALALALNRTAELAGWDEEALGAFFRTVADEVNLEALGSFGFEAEEIERLSGQFAVAESPPAELASGDREPFQQMAFTLHDDQAARVKAALAKAKDAEPDSPSPNKNSNGNALDLIARAYLGLG